MPPRDRRLSRRGFLRLLGGAALSLPFTRLLPMGQAFAADGVASRLIVFYFPDGVPGASQDGDPSKWRCTGSEFNFSLSPVLDALGSRKDDCVFLNGLSMGPTDSGSHPGGAKKLLTAVDGGGGESIDQHLARTVGAGAPHRHLYLGAHAAPSGSSSDRFISYTGPGQTVTPDDNPLRAFERLFSTSPGPGGGGGDPMQGRDLRETVIDNVLAETEALKSRLDTLEASKINQHLEALREVERRIKNDAMENMPPPQEFSCDDPDLDARGVEEAYLYDASRFPDVLGLQIDLMVQAMACGLSQVGVLQASQHTSELVMSQFPGTEMYDPGYDMRSHQASHYGARHDTTSREYNAFVQQRRWFVSRFKHLLDRLDAYPEGDGTMLDHSLILLCTEVSDGNTHLHDDMPFVLAGRAGGALSTGRLLEYGGDRHANLLVSIAQKMGASTALFGQASSGPLWGL